MFPLFYCVLISLSSASQDSLIDWHWDRKLNWNDFKAEPRKGDGAAALTSTNIKIDCEYHNNEAVYHIRCSFDKNKSWGRVKNDYILSHEQAHFDIAEIYARKLNRSLKSYKPDENNFSQDVNKIYEKLMQEYYKRQEEYDKETNFSINKIKQEEWLKKVSSELNALKKYSNYN
ncbi:MAG: DUF922 domain-containing protein [Bacteroidetes bacterium]|nr:DUF922 domain-containing protein [Bacteroidota bacterium]